MEFSDVELKRLGELADKYDIETGELLEPEEDRRLKDMRLFDKMHKPVYGKQG